MNLESKPIHALLSIDDQKRLDSLIELVLLPSTQTKDEEMQVMRVWIQSSKLFLRKLLYLCLNHLATSDSYLVHLCENKSLVNDKSPVIIQFLSNLMFNDTFMKEKKENFIYFLFLHSQKSLNNVGSDNISTPLHYCASLDLIETLRWTLSGGIKGISHNIPSNIDKDRQRSFTMKEKRRMSICFDFVLECIIYLGNTCSVDERKEKLLDRFVKEIFTVPLLTWKIDTDFLFSSLPRSVASKPSSMNKHSHFMVLIRNFILQNKSVFYTKELGLATTSSTSLSSSYFNEILPSIELSKCPAPSILCLLSNLIQFGRDCSEVNALKQENPLSSSSTSGVSSTNDNRLLFNPEFASDYFNFLSFLLNHAPLGVFTKRQAVEWIHPVKGSSSCSTPIILSPIVIELCQTLLLDSWVRALFNKATSYYDGNIGYQKHQELSPHLANIYKKSEKDLKLEKEMVGIENSAMTLAANEATVTRGEGLLWQSSKWAKQLKKNVSKMFQNKTDKSNFETPSSRGEGKLMNTSDVSRQLAHDGKTSSMSPSAAVSSIAIKSDTKKNTNQYHCQTPDFFYALCRVYGTILSRFGGGGGRDLIIHQQILQQQYHPKINGSEKDLQRSHVDQTATTKAEPIALSLLNVLCFSTNVLKTTCAVLQSQWCIESLHPIVDPNKTDVCIRSLKILPVFSCMKKENSNGNIGVIILYLFLSTLSHSLLITDDVEIDMDKPLPKHQLRRCILLLKKILYRACFIDLDKKISGTTNPPFSTSSHHFALSLLYISSKTMRDLYDRSSRKPLLILKHWLIEDLFKKELANCKTHHDYLSLLHSPVLAICPYFVPFQRRLVLFNHIITTSRLSIQGSNRTHNLQPGKNITITRGRILEDGLLHLNNLRKNELRKRLIVSYRNEAGTRETGVDAGGLFKEFWCDLSQLAFDPNYALFKTTDLLESGSYYLYPNPSSFSAHGSDHIVLFEFLGRILGKALFEQMTIQPQFAHFFLSFMRGQYNYMHMLSDLNTLDPVLYNNLMFLKTYEGDATDLCLTFTATRDNFGKNQEIELIPNGANIDVTNLNKQRYISSMAKYHVCDQLRSQSEAFTRGLWDVIDPLWLRFFNEPELQVLISGSSSLGLDVSDLRSNVKYTGGYTGIDIHIHRFWNVVSSLTPKQQAALLKFVTSCERPPASGFKAMNPPFTIQRVRVSKDNDKLPSASTCFNTLKLPTYSSEKMMKRQLLYAIEAGAGFELT